MVIKKEKLLTVNFILTGRLHDRFVTVHSKCSKIPPLTTMHFATPMQRLRVVRLS